MKYNKKVQLNIKYNFQIVKLIDHLNLNVAELDHHTGGKWLVHGTKHRKENQLQMPETPLSCRLSLGENIYQTKWKSIYSSIRSIIRKCKTNILNPVNLHSTCMQLLTTMAMLSSGHYTASAICCNEFYYCNDDRITVCDKSNIRD